MTKEPLMAKGTARHRPHGEDRLAALLRRLRVLDLVVLVASCLLGFAIRHETFVMPDSYWAALIVAGFEQQVAAGAAGLYARRRPGPLPSQLAAILFSLSATFLGLFAIAYLAKTSGDFSRTWALLWFFGSAAGMTALRLLLFRGDPQRRRLRVRAVLLAPPGAGAAVADRLAIDGAGPIEIVAHLDPAGDGARLAARCAETGAELVLLAGPPAAFDAALRRQLRQLPLRICALIEPGFDHPVVSRPELLGGALSLELYPPVIDGDGAVVKRLEDLLLGTLLTLALSPLLLLIAAAIRLDGPGPVLFRQQRFGFRGEVFTIYKFRTMRPGADGTQAVRGDPRVTRLGRWLRRFSLDELPQLLNVLRGDMALVGPRPHALAHDEAFAATVEIYAQRRKLKPGITGWAQVHGWRGEIKAPRDLERRLAHDLYYLENWSLGLDLWVLVLTPARILWDRNAY